MKTDNNPKTAFGNKKSSTCYTPQPVLHEIGLAFLEGALKYGPYNWRDKAITMSTYYDAIRRHLDVWWEGEDIDQDCGLSHLVKAAACLILLRDAELNGKLNDDRPCFNDRSWMGGCNEKAHAVRVRLDQSVTETPCQHTRSDHSMAMRWTLCTDCGAVKDDGKSEWMVKP